MIAGIGVDLVETERMHAFMTRRPQALQRWFHPLEIQGLGQGKERIARLSARFAAKEALIKACGGMHGGHLADIALLRRPGQPAQLLVAGPLGEWISCNDLVCWVSVSHERQTAAALVVLEHRA